MIDNSYPCGVSKTRDAFRLGIVFIFIQYAYSRRVDFESITSTSNSTNSQLESALLFKNKMRSSSPTPIPAHSTTPRRHLSISSHQPLRSSPLASASASSSSPRSSPSSPAWLTQRRRSNYKTAFPLLLRTPSADAQVEEPQKAFLRERFKARCFERVKKDRERARRRVSGRCAAGRRGSCGSSDVDGDFDMDNDEDDGDEMEDENTAMEDEVRELPSSFCFFLFSGRRSNN